MALKGIAFCDTWVGRNFRLAIFLILWGGKDEDMEQEKKKSGNKGHEQHTLLIGCTFKNKCFFAA